MDSENSGQPELSKELEGAIIEAIGDSAKMAREMFREALIPAVKSIVDLATFDSNSKLRFEAAKYVVERNLGKVADKLQMGTMWDELFSEIEAHANQGQGPEPS
jgi:hypothetical protein